LEKAGVAQSLPIWVDWRYSSAKPQVIGNPMTSPKASQRSHKYYQLLL
jgi:hypothetical protein